MISRVVFCLSLCGLTCLTVGDRPLRADDLFSRSGAQSIFGGTLAEDDGPTPRTDPAPAPAPSGDEALTSDRIADLLREAGFEPEDAAGPSSRVKIERGIWTFPVHVLLSPSETQLWLVLPLKSLGDAPPAEKLLGLLEASDKYGPTHFAYVAKSKMAFLNRALENRGVTAETLRDHIDLLTEVAEETATLWNPDEWQPAHVGTWQAQAGEAAFTLTLNADGTYSLASTAGDGSTTEGTYTLQDGTLVLSSGENDRLEVDFTRQPDGRFLFRAKNAPSDNTGLVFTRR